MFTLGTFNLKTFNLDTNYYVALNYILNCFKKLQKTSYMVFYTFYRV